MTYLRSATLTGRICGQRASASSPECYDASYTLGATDILAAGSGIAITGDPVSALIAQVNRFSGASVPAPYRYATTPYAVATGKVPDGVATTALMIEQASLATAIVGIPDAGTAAKLVEVSAGFGNPVAYVTAHLAEVTQRIAAYGDYAKLPPAPGGTSTEIIPGTGITMTTALLIGGVLVGAWLYGRRKKAR